MTLAFLHVRVYYKWTVCVCVLYKNANKLSAVAPAAAIYIIHYCFEPETRIAADNRNIKSDRRNKTYYYTRISTVLLVCSTDAIIFVVYTRFKS